MDYTIKEINGNLVIFLIEPGLIGLQELLNTIDTYKITLEDIIEKIDLVRNGESRAEQIGTEKAMIEITPNGIEIYDMFVGLIEDEELFPTIYLSYNELHEIIQIWKCEKEQYFTI